MIRDEKTRSEAEHKRSEEILKLNLQIVPYIAECILEVSRESRYWEDLYQEGLIALWETALELSADDELSVQERLANEVALKMRDYYDECVQRAKDIITFSSIEYPSKRHG